MATRKIIVKTAKKRRGTVSRAAIRKVVREVFGAAKTEQSFQSAKATGRKRGRISILQA
jgi:hypothetical protein